MRKCLVTGATGLIGQNLLNKLLEAGWEVYALIRNLDVKERSLFVSKQCHYLNCDLSDHLEISSFPSKLDAVIHLAQENEFRNFPHSARKIFDVNVAGTMCLLEYARTAKAKRFVLASSGGIYEAGYGKIQEDDCISPERELGFYLGTKLCSEILAKNYSDFMSVIRCRFFFVYGKSQRETMLIPRLINSVENGSPIYLEGKNGLLINPINVKDAVSAILSALNLEHSDVFNIAGPTVLSLREISMIIAKEKGKEPNFEIDFSKKEKHLVADISKMKRKLFTPEIYFQEGIKDFN